MADNFTVNSGLGGVDTRQLLRQAQQASNSDVVGNAGFEKALGIANNVMSLAGPAVGAATPFMGFKGAAITGAAVSAFSGGSGGISTPGFGTGISATGKALAMPGTAPGFPGGSSGGIPGAAPGFPGSSSPMGPAGNTGGLDTGQMDSQINAAAAQNAEMLAIQFKMQNMSQMSQMMSNIAKTDSDAKLNAIRNVKA